MKKILSLFALSCLGMVASAQTVIAHMQDFVSAKTVGTMPEAVSTWQTSVQGGGIYNFNGSSYIGGCAIEAVDAAFKGDKMVTVAAWVYGVPGTNNCLFGYGENDTGVKFMMNGTSFKTTTKGVADFTTASNSNIQAGKWNLIAFAFPGKTCSTQQYRYYATATDGQYNTYDVGSTQKMNDPSTNKSAVGSGNQGSAREAYNGMIANLVVIESSDFLTNSAIKNLIGDAPSAVVRPDYAINFDNAAHSHPGNAANSRQVTQIVLGDQTIDITAAGNYYQDLTETASFTIKAGQSVKPQIIWNGSWMAGYVYVDKDASDKQFTVEELVSNTAGEGTHNFTTDLPAFTIENTGDYRMRYKVDWNSTDPGGSSSIKANGGYILDVMLHVEAAEDIQYTLHIDGDVTDGVNVTYDENTVANGENFTAPNNLGSGDLTVNGLPSYMAATIVIEDQNVYVTTHYAYYHALKRAETLEVGKKYMIFNAVNNGGNDNRSGFMKGAPSVTHEGVHTNPLVSKLGYEYLWTLENGTAGTYYIKNVSTDKYVGSNGAVSNSGVDLYIQPWATATINKGDNRYSYNRYYEVVADDFDNVYAIANSSTGGTCWNGNATAFTTWSNSHPWAFYEVCGVGESVNNDIIEIARDYAAHKVAQNAPHATKYGTFQEATTASTDALVAGTSTFDQYVAAINGVVAANVVAPAKGSFLRMQGTSGKYISGTAETKSVSSANRRVTTDNAEDAIFWYGTDGALVGYKSGQGFTATCEVAGVGAEMNTQVFGGDASSVAGTLTIISAGSGANTNSYFYDHTDPHGVVNRNGTNHQTNCDWIVTDVTSLPVALTQVGELAYASFNAPVAVTVPSSVTAYSATVSGDVLELTAFTGTNLAAGTPVILTAAAANTYNFDIVASGDAFASDLKGTVAKQNVAADKTTYVLNKKEGKIGFYTSETFINGFKAYCEVEAAASNALSFRFEDVVTAIEAIQSENNGAEIFDLQGRRLAKAQKGMNIINGHKVLVK